MVTISLCMIVKNEEEIMNRCLSVFSPVVDEIIIVDTGSTDKTKEVCSLYTDKIYDFKWINDFSAARNYAYSFATMDYIMWVDADDVMKEKDIEKLMELKEKLQLSVDVVMMKYNVNFDAEDNPIFSFYRERLTKRANNYKWKEPVHEVIETFGNIIYEDIAITHSKPSDRKRDSQRNIQIYEGQISKGIELSPRGKYYYGRELKDHGRWEDGIVQFESFLKEGKGWKEDNITACQELAKCYFQVGKREEGLNTLFRSFIYDLPRGETCCQIGYYYQGIGDYKSSVFWFQFILTLERRKDILGFVQPDCWGYIPMIECAVGYDRLGDYEKASKYNEMALLIKPNSVAALNNKKYFEGRQKSSSLEE